MVAITAVMLGSSPACASPPDAGAPRAVRVVAVGDLHGDLDNAVATLRLAGLVDDD